MSPSRRYVEFDDQLAWLERQPASRLLLWLEDALAYGLTTPLVCRGELTICDLIIQLGESSKSSKFRKRLEKVLVKLVWEWKEKKHGDEFFAKLLDIVGYLEVGGAYNRLVWWANTGDFKGRVGDGEDLHLRTLRVIAGLGIRGKAGGALCQSSLSDSRYALVCFQALIDKNRGNGIEFLPAIVKHAAAAPHEFDLHVALNDLVSTLTFDFFAHSLFTAAQRMSGPEKGTLLLALNRIGYACLLNSGGGSGDRTGKQGVTLRKAGSDTGEPPVFVEMDISQVPVDTQLELVRHSIEEWPSDEEIVTLSKSELVP